MMKIPDHLITQVKAGESLIVAKVGHGIASLCGEKVVIEIPSDTVVLGERFFATATNRIVKRLTLENMISPDKNTMLTYKKRRF